MSISNNIYYHCSSLIGLRQKNEDEILVIENIDSSIPEFCSVNSYSVFDGHGGDKISKFLKDKYGKYILNKKFIDEIDKSKKSNKKIKLLYEAMQKNITDLNMASRYCGSTALTCIVYGENNKYLKIINLGDCRAVACNENNIAIALTKDHRPDSYEELKRIKKLGGVVEYSKDDDPRIDGMSVSRSLGDLDSKPYISHNPDIYDYDSKKYSFIILACDGVWEVLKNQEAIDFVLSKLDEIKIDRNCKQKSKSNIANLLAEYALEKKSTDNLSVVIIFLDQ